MLTKARSEDRDALIAFLSKDPGRHYFMLLGIYKGMSCFESIDLQVENKEIQTAIFKRKSGNLQIGLSKGSDLDLVKEWLSTHDFRQVIGPESYCKPLMAHLKLVKRGAEISELLACNFVETCELSPVVALGLDQVDAVEVLYKKVFPSYAGPAYMKEKLRDKRGLAFYIPDMKSVAQSDMSSVIVGVATDPDYQGQGLARAVMTKLIKTMFISQDSLYLHYDDPRAKALYMSLGFRVIDQVCYYEKRK